MAIKCRKDWGPYFGNGELSVLLEPFNEPNACWSWANFNGYKIPVNSEGINMLTIKKSVKDGSFVESRFTIREIEVWGVTL